MDDANSINVIVTLKITAIKPVDNASYVVHTNKSENINNI